MLKNEHFRRQECAREEGIELGELSAKGVKLQRTWCPEWSRKVSDSSGSKICASMRGMTGRSRLGERADLTEGRAKAANVAGKLQSLTNGFWSWMSEVCRDQWQIRPAKARVKMSPSMGDQLNIPADGKEHMLSAKEHSYYQVSANLMSRENFTEVDPPGCQLPQ